MIFKEIPLKDTLFAQHQDYLDDTNADIAAYAPNVVTAESEDYTGGFTEGGDVQIVKGIESLKGQFFKKISNFVWL